MRIVHKVEEVIYFRVTPSADSEFSMAFPQRQPWNLSPHITAHSSYLFQLDI